MTKNGAGQEKKTGRKPLSTITDVRPKGDLGPQPKKARMRAIHTQQDQYSDSENYKFASNLPVQPVLPAKVAATVKARPATPLKSKPIALIPASIQPKVPASPPVTEEDTEIQLPDAIWCYPFLAPAISIFSALTHQQNASSSIISERHYRNILIHEQEYGMVSYTAPITAQLFLLEKQWLACTDYPKRHVGITREKRAILINILVDLVRRTDWSGNIIHQAVYLLDHYLARTKEIILEYQLMEIAVACLMLAYKTEDARRFPLHALCESLFPPASLPIAKEHILQQEYLILLTIDWQLSLPTPYTFLKRFMLALTDLPSLGPSGLNSSTNSGNNCSSSSSNQSGNNSFNIHKDGSTSSSINGNNIHNNTYNNTHNSSHNSSSNSSQSSSQRQAVYFTSRLISRIGQCLLERLLLEEDIRAVYPPSMIAGCVIMMGKIFTMQEQSQAKTQSTTQQQPGNNTNNNNHRTAQPTTHDNSNNNNNHVNNNHNNNNNHLTQSTTQLPTAQPVTQQPLQPQQHKILLVPDQPLWNEDLASLTGHSYNEILPCFERIQMILAKETVQRAIGYSREILAGIQQSNSHLKQGGEEAEEEEDKEARRGGRAAGGRGDGGRCNSKKRKRSSAAELSGYASSAGDGADEGDGGHYDQLVHWIVDEMAMIDQQVTYLLQWKQTLTKTPTVPAVTEEMRQRLQGYINEIPYLQARQSYLGYLPGILEYAAAKEMKKKKQQKQMMKEEKEKQQMMGGGGGYPMASTLSFDSLVTTTTTTSSSSSSSSSSRGSYSASSSASYDEQQQQVMLLAEDSMQSMISLLSQQSPYPSPMVAAKEDPRSKKQREMDEVHEIINRMLALQGDEEEGEDGEGKGRMIILDGVKNRYEGIYSLLITCPPL